MRSNKIQNLVFLILLSQWTSWVFALESTHQNHFYLLQQNYFHDYAFAHTQENMAFVESTHQIYFNSNIDLKISPQIYFFNMAPVSSTTNNQFIENGEYVVNLNSKKHSLTLGSFNLKKEGSDLFDPLDRLSPKIYKIPTQLVDQPLRGIKIESSWTNSFITEFVYVPQNRLPVLPDESSPWLPRESELPIVSPEYLVRLPNQVKYKIQNNTTEKDTDLNDHFLIKVKKTFSYADILLQYSESLDNTPQINPTLTGQLISTSPVLEIELANPVELTVKWRKVKNYGAGLQIPIESLSLLTKFFINQKVYDNFKGQQFSMALEKNISSSTWILEHTTAQDNQSSAETNLNTSLMNQSEILKNTTGLALRLSITEGWSLLAGHIYDHQSKSQLALARLKYQNNKGWYSEVQGLTLQAPDTAFLSNFKNNSNAAFKIGYEF